MIYIFFHVLILIFQLEKITIAPVSLVTLNMNKLMICNQLKDLSLIKSLFYAIYLSLMFVLFSCASQSDWSTVADWDKFDDSDLPDQEDYPNSGAVILLDEGIVEISDGGEIDLTYFERHRIVKVFNTSGYSYANVSISYNENSDVELIEARTISANGKITVLNEDNIFDITLYPRFIFFSDQRAKIFTFPAVEEGCILEYKYRLAMEGNSLIHSWYFQNSSPTQLSRFSLQTPSQWEINDKLYNININSTLHKTANTNKSTRTWEAKDLDEFPSEIAMPSTKDISARIEISPVGFNTWSDVALWYHNLSESQMIIDEKISDIALRLTEDTEDEVEKVKRIFEWVRDRVRYVAVSIGIGGFKPHRADEILLNRYGDCKDMTTLFCSAARAVDIPVQQVLISTKPNGQVDTSLVSPFQFNHVIAYYPIEGDSGLWLDATKKGNPFDKVPWYNQDRLAFVVDENGEGVFKRTPSYSEFYNKILVEWKVDLNSDLNANIEGRSSFSGALATEIRQDLMDLSDKRLRQWVEGYLSSRCPGIDLHTFSISNADTVRDPLIISYQFATELFASKSDNMAVIDLARILLIQLPDYFRSKERRTPIEFRHGSIYQLNLTLNLSNGWYLQQSSRNDSINSKYGAMNWKWETIDNEFRVHHEYQLYGHSISQASYKDYQDFLESIDENDMVPAILLKN